MFERSNVDFPMWRKKVDATLLKEGSTPIPKWLWDVWGIERNFSNVQSKKDDTSSVSIEFENKLYNGQVTKVKSQSGPKYRLQFENTLKDRLSEVYLMTYMRVIEAEITVEKNNREVENEISFWEFVDIEFNADEKIFFLNAYYKVKPQFPNLFSQLIRSAPMKSISSQVLDKCANKIHKQDWKNRAFYKSEIGAENVIYMLLDTELKLLYVGEANNLVKRFNNGHPDIKNWNYYKYNVLPKELTPFRLSIERMIIRDMATILENKQSIPNIQISDYRLANRKIDQ